MLVKVILHAADLSNATRSFPITSVMVQGLHNEHRYLLAAAAQQLIILVPSLQYELTCNPITFKQAYHSLSHINDPHGFIDTVMIHWNADGKST